MPDTARFELRVVGASSLKAVRWEPPPYACGATRDLSRADERLVIEKWRSHGCERSVSWEMIAGAIGNPDVIFDISWATVQSNESGGRVTLRLGGRIEPEVHWRTLELEGRRLEFRHAGGAELTEAAFVALGAECWESRRRERAKPESPR